MKKNSLRETATCVNCFSLISRTEQNFLVETSLSLLEQHSEGEIRHTLASLTSFENLVRNSLTSLSINKKTKVHVLRDQNTLHKACKSVGRLFFQDLGDNERD